MFKMKHIKFLILLILFTFLISCTKEPGTNNSLAGTVDETDTGIEAMLFNPDGTPAKEVSVKFFKVADTSKVPVLEVFSDENGVFTTKGLGKGNYNIYAEKGSLVAFQDSITVYEDTAYIDNDTLETPKALSAFVGLQPNHDPRTVTVQVLGTDMYSNVNEDGTFTLNKMATGDFTFKLSTTLNNYTVTYKDITIETDTPDTLSDTLWLIYTGIPVVVGLTASYDTATGIVSLFWKNTKYGDLQDYLIYRDFYDTINLSSTPLSLANDTVFYDTIFNNVDEGGLFSFSDTNTYHFKYRVKIRNNSQEVGLSYKYIDIVTPSPQEVSSNLSYKTYHLYKEFYTDSSSVNDSIRYSINVKNRQRKLVYISYKDLQNDSILKNISIDSLNEYQDSLILLWNKIGVNYLEISTNDISGYVKKDTIPFTVVEDMPSAELTNTNISLNDTTTLKANINDKYGKVIKIEWQVGIDANFAEGDINSCEKEIFISDTMLTSISILIKITDDDNNITIDTSEISVETEWKQISLPSQMNYMQDITVFNNAIYSVVSTYSDNYSVWKSIDGETWEEISDITNWSQYYNFSEVKVAKNKMHMIGVPKYDSLKTIVLNSNDGINWNSTETDFNFKSYSYKIFFASFKDTLYVGEVDSTTYGEGGNLFSSADGITWDTITNEGEEGIVPPPTDYKYSITETSDALYIASTVVNGDSIHLYKTENWKTIDNVKKFPSLNYSGLGAFQINNYMDKLCTYEIIKEQDSRKIIMKYTDNLDEWTQFSELIVPDNFYFLKCIAFQGENYIIGGNIMWRSN